MTYLEVDLDRLHHIGLAEAKSGLSRIVASAESAGESVVIERYGRPAALVVPFPRPASGGMRARGALRDYVDPDKQQLESGAFARAMEVKHAGEANTPRC